MLPDGVHRHANSCFLQQQCITRLGVFCTSLSLHVVAQLLDEQHYQNWTLQFTWRSLSVMLKPFSSFSRSRAPSWINRRYYSYFNPMTFILNTFEACNDSRVNRHLNTHKWAPVKEKLFGGEKHFHFCIVCTHIVRKCIKRNYILITKNNPFIWELLKVSSWLLLARAPMKFFCRSTHTSDTAGLQ